MDSKYRSNASAPSVADAWTELRSHLERRGIELNAEVHSYPSPIARCDDQLPKLLEQRARVVWLLKAANELGGTPAAASVDAGWLERLQGFLSGRDAVSADDEAEIELRSRLSAALAQALRTADSKE
jgi:hypothetical protein